MNGKPVDISDWDAAQRSVTYRLSHDQTVFGMILGMRIESDGACELALYADNRAMSWQVRAQFGKSVKQWQFVKPLPEIQEILSILTGEVKPGAPLPALSEKPSDAGRGRKTAIIDPLDEEPVRPERETAVKNTRL
jgi:hypothetical protein